MGGCSRATRTRALCPQGVCQGAAWPRREGTGLGRGKPVQLWLRASAPWHPSAMLHRSSGANRSAPKCGLTHLPGHHGESGCVRHKQHRACFGDRKPRVDENEGNKES